MSVAYYGGRRSLEADSAIAYRCGLINISWAEERGRCLAQNQTRSIFSMASAALASGGQSIIGSTSSRVPHHCLSLQWPFLGGVALAFVTDQANAT